VSEPKTDRPDRTPYNHKIKLTAFLVRANAVGSLKELTIQKAAGAAEAELGFPVTARGVGSICRALGLETRQPTRSPGKKKSRWAILTLRTEVDRLTATVAALEARLGSLETALGISGKAV
jgi:hypothetical protein